MIALLAVLLLARGARAQDEDPAPSTAVSSSSDACANRGALDADSLIAGLVSDAGVSCISASIEVPFFGGVVTMSTDPIEVDMPCQGPTTVAGELAIAPPGLPAKIALGVDVTLQCVASAGETGQVVAVKPLSLT